MSALTNACVMGGDGSAKAFGCATANGRARRSSLPHAPECLLIFHALLISAAFNPGKIDNLYVQTIHHDGVGTHRLGRLASFDLALHGSNRIELLGQSA